jgi:hypothetical protein
LNVILVETPAAIPSPILFQESVYRALDTTPKPTIPQPSRRNFFGKAASKAKIASTIDSTARTGEDVARRRFQRGSVYKNKTGTMWLGIYAEYILDAHGAEKRNRKQVVLCPVKNGEQIVGKREAQKLLQPYVDRMNCSLGTPVRERKSATFEAFGSMTSTYFCARAAFQIRLTVPQWLRIVFGSRPSDTIAAINRTHSRHWEDRQ